MGRIKWDVKWAEIPYEIDFISSQLAELAQLTVAPHMNRPLDGRYTENFKHIYKVFLNAFYEGRDLVVKVGLVYNKRHYSWSWSTRDVGRWGH